MSAPETQDSNAALPVVLSGRTPTQIVTRLVTVSLPLFCSSHLKRARSKEVCWIS